MHGWWQDLSFIKENTNPYITNVFVWDILVKLLCNNWRIYAYIYVFFFFCIRAISVSSLYDKYHSISVSVLPRYIVDIYVHFIFSSNLVKLGLQFLKIIMYKCLNLFLPEKYAKEVWCLLLAKLILFIDHSTFMSLICE